MHTKNQEAPDNTQAVVRTFEFEQRRVVLVGTAHISEQSAQLVEHQLLKERPHTLFVELDARRMKNMEGDSSWKNVHIEKALRRKQGMLMLASVVLSTYQRRIAKKLGVEPGLEMLTAIRIAKEHRIPIHPCDRRLETTLLRAWRRSSFLSKLKLITVMFASLFQRESVNEEEVERLKHGNTLDSLMGEFASYLPQVKNVLIDERDSYIAAHILHSTSPHIVAVVGAGHLAGIASHITRYQTTRHKPSLKPLEEVPPRSRVGRALLWVIPLAVATLIALGFVYNGWEGGLRALTRWIVVNGTLSAVGCLIARAHPLTVGASFLAAPVTSLNPTIGVGFVSALLEITLRKPRASDLENLPHDTLSVRGFYRNRLSHALLVFILSSVGSAIGTFIALPLLFPS